MSYAYIERAYGKRFEAGQRVRFTEYAGKRGLGVVVGVRGDPQYVKVRFDNGQVGDCHPGSVVLLLAEAMLESQLTPPPPSSKEES